MEKELDIKETLEEIEKLIARHRNTYIYGIQLPAHLICIPRKNNNARALALSLLLIIQVLETAGKDMTEREKNLLFTAEDCIKKLELDRELLFDKELNANPPSWFPYALRFPTL